MIIIFSFFFGSHLLAQTSNSPKEQLIPPSKLVGASPNIETEKAVTSSETFKLSTLSEPQGTNIEAQIARAEFYKAQYAHDAATQAKYQQSIEALKKELAKNATSKQD